jgi:apolipoprotein N-acyltransferase
VNWSSLAQPVILAWGWRRALIAFLAGAGSTVAMAPVNFWPAMFVTFTLAVWILDGAGGTRWGGIRAGFVAGWCFGFGYLLAGLYWIGNAFLVEAKVFGWLLPFAVVGLPAFLALYTGFGFALARALWTRGPLRIVALAAALSLGEWLRGHVVTGFPWNAFGYALTSPLPLAQTVSLFGIWGQTFVAVAIFASPAVLADDRSEVRRPFLPLLVAGIALAAMAAYGGVRLARNPDVSVVDNVRLRIMQPNVQQDERFNYNAKQQIMSRYISLSEGSAGGLRNVNFLIWPESAFPFFLTREPDALAMIANLLAPDAVLLTGAASLAEQAPGRTGLRAYNSVYAIDHNGALLARYDKVHLVPFGEYLPFQDTLERFGLTQLVSIPGGFIPGARRTKIALPGAPDVLALICYEIIFPAEAVPRGERPGWLLNVTNDAWFGLSAGPYQHFQQARVRAVEEGLPLVRAANSGISAVVDPFGRVVGSLPLGQEGVLDTSLPQALALTTYGRTGDLPFFTVVIAALLTCFVARLQR